MAGDLGVVALGRMPYGEALTLQRDLAARRIAGTVPRDLLLLVEHPPVITLGRGFQPQHLSAPPAMLAARGIEVHEIERGGDITFHGPGQLVGYPIFDLKGHRQDLHWFLRQIEAALIVALDNVGITGQRVPGYTGVWTQDRKLASIGIHVRQWVTWHGFALNVTTDLSYFDLIVPCGIPDVQMTSVQRELAERAPRDLWNRVTDNVMLGFGEVFGMRVQIQEKV
ncbi:MAG: lipoyl(octanoyl) transferase LipB [Gemmatimonadota bacterium]|nr:lipoyl(octanoyl) transferase LipB [Gemmatimonadota bacterium]MDH4350200.1 lipoyl(octanoyl) transferase LipB [Gemmatimonadota bacterium]